DDKFITTDYLQQCLWLWVILGVGLGAALHGFVPDGWIASHLGAGQWWTVPVAVLVGIPLYSNATGVIPVMESLITNGLPVGTTLAFCMSTVAASFPEFILLKQVMKWQLLCTLLLLLLTSFTLVGWIFNVVFPLIPCKRRLSTVWQILIFLRG
ncbi:TPA: permease, partial [Klebsiella pneumoniae]